ncbi:MAG: TSUP family transporter [Clostridiales bacterium]|nr:TSUP family transporter [Clostridiales bacterium]
MEQLIFLCIMVFIAGFVDSVAGGGGIISLPAYILTGMPPHMAYGCNKFSSSCGTTFSTIRFFLHGAINIKAAIISAIASFIGAAIAARIILMLDGDVLKKILIIILPIVAVIILFKRNYGEIDNSYKFSNKTKVLFAIIIGFLVGGYDGLLGPGTGTIAILCYTAIMKYDLKTASGNAKVLNLASNYASLITFALAGSVMYKVAIPAAICNIIGNYIGSGFAIKKGAKFIRPMMMVVLVLLFGKIIFDNFII